MPGKYITEKERYQIEALLKSGRSNAEIARLLGRDRSTVGREIKRGTVIQRDGKTWEDQTVYKADAAQRKYEEKRQNKAPALKIGNDMEFVRFVEHWIKEKKYSPQAVLYKIRQEKIPFRTDVCRQTLYRYIEQGVFLNLKPEDLPCLKRRKKKPVAKRKTALHNLKGKSIEERPEEAGSRENAGHWEMDTVVSGTGKGNACLLVLSERRSRLEIIRKIPDRKAASVVKALDRLERAMGSRKFRETFRTITCDNGVEFLDHAGIERSVRNRKKRTSVYYCHPYSSWERGTNENQNRLIRRWVKKGEGIGGYSDAQIRDIESWMNSYPRGILDGRTPEGASACA